MRIQPIIALALLISGLLAAPAVAQQDERFYQRWVPYSHSAGGMDMLMDPGGYLTFADENNIYDIKRFQVIRDFGDRIVLRMWQLVVHPDGQAYDSLVVLSLEDGSEFGFIDRLFINYYYCSGGAVDGFFAGDPDADEIWRRITEWSAPSDKLEPGRNCRIREGKSEGDGWSGMRWSGPKPVLPEK